MDTVVHHHEPPPGGGEDAERIKAVAHHRQMMIPAKATCQTLKHRILTKFSQSYLIFGIN